MTKKDILKELKDTLEFVKTMEYYNDKPETILSLIKAHIGDILRNEGIINER